MKVQDEVAKGKIQLPWDFLIANLEGGSCDVNLTLQQYVLFHCQIYQVTATKSKMNSLKQTVLFVPHIQTTKMFEQINHYSETQLIVVTPSNYMITS